MRLNTHKIKQAAQLVLDWHSYIMVPILSYPSTYFVPVFSIHVSVATLVRYARSALKLDTTLALPVLSTVHVPRVLEYHVPSPSGNLHVSCINENLSRVEYIADSTYQPC